MTVLSASWPIGRNVAIQDLTPGTVIPRTTRLDASTRSTLCSIPAACAHRLDYSCPNIEATLYAP